MGLKQGFNINAKKVLSYIIKGKGYKLFDTFAMLSAYYIANIGLVGMLSGTLLLALETTYKLGLTMFGINILGMLLGPSLFAILILFVNKRKIKPMWKGILGYGLFLASWIPINLYVLFKENLEWKEMKRDSKVNIIE